MICSLIISQPELKLRKDLLPIDLHPALLLQILLLHAVFLLEFDVACVLKCKVSTPKIFPACFEYNLFSLTL
jgi:hypothetical protein